VTIREGDLVLLLQQHVRRDRSKKLSSPWIGPYTVVEIIGVNCVLRSGTKGRTFKVHSNRFKLFISFRTELWSGAAISFRMEACNVCKHIEIGDDLNTLVDFVAQTRARNYHLKPLPLASRTHHWWLRAYREFIQLGAQFFKLLSTKRRRYLISCTY
jgi:hypothetical protein